MNVIRRTLRSLIKSVTKPITNRLAFRFVRRSEYEERLFRDEARFAQQEERLSRHEARFAQQEERLSQHEARFARQEERFSQHARDAAFDRQAIHDISSAVWGGPEIIEQGCCTVGVVVPTCDRPKSLERALRSLANQSRKPDAVVVVNDGILDVSNVVESFSDTLKISLLHTKHPRSGSSIARNVALDTLDTSYITFLDDDNLMWSRWIERASTFLGQDKTVNIIYGAQLRDSEQSSVEKDWFFIPFNFERLQQQNFIDLGQIMHRVSTIRFDPKLRRLVDWDYLLRLIDQSPKCVVPVHAISTIYQASLSDRITVPYWPPALSEITLSRQRGNPIHYDGRCICNICGYEGPFSPGPGGKRLQASCPHCGSLERHRFLQLVAPTLLHFWIPEIRQHRASILEVAPSHATQQFRELFDSSSTVDFDPAADGRIVDIVASLTDLPMPSSTFDVVMALHVLEHIPEDIKAMKECARVLRPEGIVILQVPLSGYALTDEEVLESPEERIERYGQADHVRLYGDDFCVRLKEAGLTCIAISPKESMPPEAIKKYGLLPDEALIFAVRTDSASSVEMLEVFSAQLFKGRF